MAMLVRTLFCTVLSLAALASAALAEPPPVEQVITRLEGRFAKVHDYECVIESRIAGPKEVSEGIYQVWYLKPGLLKLRVEEGRHEGGEIVLGGKGRVRARPGGVLGKVVTKTMAKTDKRLKSPRGGYGWDVDFGGYYRKLRERLQYARSASVETPAGGNEVRIRLTYQDPQRPHPTEEVWMVDSRQWLLRGLDAWENGRQVERVRFRDYRENVGLTARAFGE
jgi:outer membrane lipoprotein-sorting protein